MVEVGPAIWCLRRAFAMLALAILSARPRALLSDLPGGFRCELVPENQANRLLAAVVAGDVTTIVANPQPFTFVIYRGSFGEVRTVHGLWIGRFARWRGQRLPPPHILKRITE